MPATRLNGQQILDGTIANADIATDATIAVSKLATSPSTLIGAKAAGGNVALSVAEANTLLGTASTVISNVTLSSASWSLVSGLYEYSYSNAAILAASIVTIVPRNASKTYVKAAKILPESTVSAGAVKLYAEVAPTGDIVVDIIVGI